MVWAVARRRGLVFVEVIAADSRTPGAVAQPWRITDDEESEAMIG